MQRHLEKHSIFPPHHLGDKTIQKEQPSILSLLIKKMLTPQQFLEKNLIHQIIDDNKAFITIERLLFKQIFQDIPGIILPFESSSTVKRRLNEKLDIQRQELKKELTLTCKSIALSIDIQTSKNNLPILAIIGYWLTEDFLHKKRVLEFIELQGIHSGENIAIAIQSTLSELDLQEKLITITGDNASNNETMASELFHLLSETTLDKNKIQFQGLNSYIRCLAHILNLIVKDIL